MKGRFWRSGAGKMLLHLLLSLFALLTAVCVFLAVGAAEEELYACDIDAVCGDIELRQMRYGAFDALGSFRSGSPAGSRAAEGTFELADETGTVVWSTEAVSDGDAPVYEFKVYVKEKTDGTRTYSLEGMGSALEGETAVWTMRARPAGASVSGNYEIPLMRLAYRFRFWCYPAGVLSLGLFLFCFACLLSVSGRSAETGEIMKRPADRIPAEIPLAAGGAASLALCWTADAMPGTVSYPALMLTHAALLVLLVNVVAATCAALAARLKNGTLLPCSILGTGIRLAGRGLRFLGRQAVRFWKWVKKGLASLAGRLPAAGIGLGGVLLFCLADLLFVYWGIGRDAEVAAVLYLLLWGAAAVFAVRLCRDCSVIREFENRLAAGGLEERMEPEQVARVLRPNVRCLNSIQDGMNTALEERMRSERMKTELITNVSHDIKTPVTSILNYSGLIAAEETDNEKIREYAEVLQRQSGKLKTLVENLVEASKVSTGSVEVQIARCNAGVVLSQTAGEYQEKMEEAGLALVTRAPEEELFILADGRLLGRVIDNLMSNALKYAMPGTRVYVTLEQKQKEAVFTFRNTSKDPLDLSVEELEERFVRGDSSRNTEGNGLGLSIAKGLTELQKGKLDLTIDGDLFKAAVRLPLAE